MNKANKLASLFRRKLRLIFGKNIELSFEGFTIELPANHLLPQYKASYPRYDKFLPHLAQYLGIDEIVVDVGANCGDTLASMFDKNKFLHYVCIEPDSHFFSYLLLNVNAIQRQFQMANIEVMNSFIGENITCSGFEGTGGTKHAVLDLESDVMAPSSLSNLLPVNKYNKIKLIKVDVDGFDYDVLESARSIILAQSPLLFFECFFSEEAQKTGYENIIAKLSNMGYSKWAVFDNFGGLVLTTSSIETIAQLFEYVWRQNISDNSRTIFYYDIFAASSNDSEIFNKAISSFS